MSDIVETTELRDARTGRLHKGARLPGAGRPKGSKNFSVRALAEKIGINPLQLSLQILKTQTIPGAAGVEPRKVSPELYLKLLIDMNSYFAPKLAATQVTGADDGPITTASMSMVQIMADPALAAAAQTLALGLASQAQPQIEAGREPSDYDDTPGPGAGVRK